MSTLTEIDNILITLQRLKVNVRRTEILIKEMESKIPITR